MRVYIKGMEMPENCNECKMNYDCCSCILTGTRFVGSDGFDEYESRLPNCPLISIPFAEDFVDRCIVGSPRRKERWHEPGELKQTK